MTTKRRRWPIVLAAVAVVLTVTVIALAVAGTMFVKNNVQVAEGTSPDRAAAAFDAARRAFADTRPLLSVDDDRKPSLTPGIDTRHNVGTVNTLHIVAWDADKGTLATIALPMWLLDMTSGPVVFGDYVSGMDTSGFKVDARDLKRYGPGIVLDVTDPDGHHVLITAQ